MSGRMLAVASGKGGVGKSLITVALGAQLAALGKSVVLVDMNTGMRTLDMLLGLESRIGFDLGDVLDNGCGLDRAMVQDRKKGLWLISARQLGSREDYNPRTLRIILEVLCMQHDYVLLDTPGCMSAGFAQIAELAQESLLVTSPDTIALRNAERAAGLLMHSRDKARPLLIVNRIRKDFVQEELQYAPQVCSELLDLPLFGVIEEEDALQRSFLARDPMLQGSRGQEAIIDMVLRLEGGEAANAAPMGTWDALMPLEASPAPQNADAADDIPPPEEDYAALPAEELEAIEAIAQNVSQVREAAEALSQAIRGVQLQEEAPPPLAPPGPAATAEETTQKPRKKWLSWLKRNE